MRSILCLLLCLHLVYGALNLTARNIQFVKRYNDKAWSTMTANLLHPEAIITIRTVKIPDVAFDGANAVLAMKGLNAVYGNMTKIYACAGCSQTGNDYGCDCKASFNNGDNLRWQELIRTDTLCNGTELYRYITISISEL